jgi:hypothetical protein
MTLHVLSAQTQQYCYVVGAGPFKLSHQAYPLSRAQNPSELRNARTNKEQSVLHPPKTWSVSVALCQPRKWGNGIITYHLLNYASVLSSDARDYEISTSQSALLPPMTSPYSRCFEGEAPVGSSLNRTPKLRYWKALLLAVIISFS